MKIRVSAKSLGITSCISMLALCSMTFSSVAWGADFSWRVESGSGDWDYPGSNDSDLHWWDGAAKVNAPATGSCSSILVDNDTFLAWNQNISGFSCSKLVYNAGASSVRTLTGNGITFYDCSGVKPAIINSSAVTHVIGSLTGGLVGSGNYALDVKVLGSGGLTIQSDVDNRGPSLIVTNAIGTTVLLESGVISGTGAVVKAGLGTLTLNGDNTFSGGLTHNTSGGRINLGHANALGSGTYKIDGSAGVGFDNTSGGPLTIPNAFTMSGGSPYFLGSNPLTITGAVTMTGGANRTLTVSNNIVTMTGPLGGTHNLIKQGTGTLAIVRDNSTFTGGVQTVGGYLAIGHVNALGSGTFVLNGGNYDNTTGGDIVLPTPVLIGGSSYYAGLTNSMTITNTITLNGNRTLGVLSNKVTLASSVSETGAGTWTLTTYGAGTLELTASNDIRGGIVIGASSRFNIGHANALGTGLISFGSGSKLENTSGAELTVTNNVKFTGSPTFVGNFNPLTFVGTADINISSFRTFTISSNVFTFQGGVIGTGGLTKAGSGTLVLNGDGTFLGGLTLGAGVVKIGHSNALGFGTCITGGNIFDNVGTNDFAVTNAFSLNGSPIYAGETGNLELSGPVTMNANRTMTVSNRTLKLSGTVGPALLLTKAGAGTLTLSGNNATLNGVTASTGTLNIAHINALGTGTFSVGQATFDNLSGGALILSNAFTFAGNPTFSGTDPLTFTGAVSLAASRVLTVANGALTLAGHIVNASLSLAKDGPGTLVLSGTNSHQNGTILSNGTLCLNSAKAAGSGRLIIAGVSTLDNTSGGEIAMANAHEWHADFTFAGANSLNMGTNTVYLNGSRTITVSANTLTVGGTITVTNGLSSGLTKEGAGLLVIGKPVVYTGDTTVNDGTLALSGAGALLTSTTLTVAAGATLDASLRTNGILALTSVQTLKGGGTVLGNVTNSGVVAPGASPGILSVVGDYRQTGTGTLAIELSGTTPGSGHDVLAVATNATLGGTLTVTTPSFTPSAGQIFTVLTAAAVSGTFATTNLPAGDWTVDYQADKVVLTLAGGPAAPNLEVTPASLSFAATRVGETSDLIFTVTNSGAAQLDGTATVSGVAFTLQSGSPFSVAVGGVASVTVRFTPTMTASYSEDVTFLSNGGGSTNAVSGTGYVQAIATNGAITLVSGQPTFGFTLVSGALYRVQASTNLLDGAGWMDVTEYLTNNYPGGIIPAYSETNVATYPRRAYRISSP